MANYNIELNRWSGSEFDQLLPRNNISGTGEPTTSTVGIVGQIYMDTSTDPATSYQCVKVDGGVYTWTKSKADNAVIRTYPVAAGQSVTAGDVVNIADGKVVNYGTIPVGGVLQLNENGAPVDYVVVHQGLPSSMYDDSCNGTWVLRKDILKIAQWDSSNVNDYANSTIQADLNSTFLARFDSATQAAIKQVKIPYRPGSGASTTINSGANGLPCKIFLLSEYEVAVEHPDLPQDGTVLDYFTSDILARRIAYLDGSVTNWWLRSPDTSGSAIVWIVNSTGAGNDLCPSYNGIRPAFVLRPSGSQAIALTTATAGQPCEVIYSGVASLPGITEGQKITSDGVYGVGIFSNVLQVWSKDRPSDFKIGDTLSTLRTDLGDKWLLCNGEDLDTNTYPELAKKITELNFSDFITEGYATGEIYSEAEYGGVYVQAGQITSTYGGAYKALLWYSTNPRGSTNDWNKCTLSEFFDGILTKVRVHNGTWVAVGYQRDNLYPYILTTTNPKGTWTVKQLLKTPCMLSGLVYAFNKWVAVGSVGSGQPKVFTATDPSGSWSDGVLSTTTNLNITNIAFNGTFLCAVGYDNSDVPYLVKNTSLSGTWETTRMTISNQPTSHPKIHPNSIAFSNGNWVVGCAVDEVNDYTWLARILVSSDLVTWTYKKIKSSDLTYVHAKYGAFVNFYNNKWYVTSSMERDQSYLCWTDNLGDSWSVKKLSSSGCCVKGADVANGYLFILGREYRSEKVGYYVVNKILPRISLNGVYTYIKAKE